MKSKVLYVADVNGVNGMSNHLHPLLQKVQNADWMIHHSPLQRNRQLQDQAMSLGPEKALDQATFQLEKAPDQAMSPPPAMTLALAMFQLPESTLVQAMTPPLETTLDQSTQLGPFHTSAKTLDLVKTLDLGMLQQPKEMLEQAKSLGLAKQMDQFQQQEKMPEPKKAMAMAKPLPHFQLL